MAESPPPSSPLPPHPPIPSDNSDPHQQPSPKPAPESADLSHIRQPQNPETQNPHIPIDPQAAQNSNPEEETQIVGDDQDQDDPEPEPEPEQEGMSNALSSPRNSSISDSHGALESKGTPSARRPSKRKKGLGKKSQIAQEKKLQTLCQNFNPIPFVPGKRMDFDPHEELLKKLGLWDFAHLELDRSLRADLIAKLIVNYTPRVRGSYVNDCKIGVNRADLGRALKLPGKKGVGDCEGEEFPAEFLSFLEDFVSNWMLVHEDLWCMPTEVVNWMTLIKDGHPEKVDWAGLVWFMAEKELAQGINLKDCYYASHLQQLIKVQKEELLRENPQVDLTVDDDEDGGDVKMLDSDVSVGGPRSEENNVELGDSRDSVAPMEIVGHDKVEKVDGDEKMEEVEKTEEGGDVDKVEKLDDVGSAENVDEACHAVSADEDCNVANVGDQVVVGSADDVRKKENDGGVQNAVSANEVLEEEKVDDVDVHNAGSGVEVGKVDNIESAGRIENIESVDGHVDNADEHVENVDNIDEHIEVFDNTENVEEGKGGDMMDFGYCKGDEQGQWLLDGKNEGGQHFLQRCSVPDAKHSIENGRQIGLSENIKHEVIEEDEHVEGFRIMQKGSLDGIPQANLMHAFETGQLQFSSADLGGQPSLELMSPRVENNMMLGGPSMFNHSGKREIDHDHDIAHHTLSDNHKKMRIDGPWGHHKSSEFDIVMDQILHLVEKAKMTHEAEKEEAYEHGSVNQQFIANEMSRKDNEILQLRCKLEELERRRQAEVHRLDRELYLMNSVIDGYRSALKDTQKAFAEFRKRCAVPDEPVYKDAGSGGVVKSVVELEKERIKQEQERKAICHFLEETFIKQMENYELKWEGLLVKVQSLDERLLTAAGEVELLQEHHGLPKASESAPDVSEDH